MTEAELIEKIVASDSFQASTQLGGLLRFIYDRQVLKERTLASDIEILYFEHPEGSRHYSTKRARERVAALKKFLGRFYAEGHIDDLVCSISGGSMAHGYRIAFRAVNPTRIATDNFWEAHVESEDDIVIVGDALLFFYEHSQGRYIRYVDSNIEGNNREKARKTLDALHPQHRDETLVTGHLYVDVGSINAAETLKDYFWDKWRKRVPYILEKDDPRGRWANGSPVFISTPRTNGYMDDLFSRLPAKQLSYRFPQEQFACVQICDGPTEYERSQINRLADGITWLNGETITTTQAALTLGVISRIPNPDRGGGALTFISTDATWSAQQMAVTVCNEKLIRRMFDAMEWSYAEPVPPAFEILFSIELFPGNQSDKAGVPQVIIWRPRPNS